MIIGVAGEKKHGKDTVAQYLVKEYDYQQRAFADHLKELCSRIFNVPLQNMYDETKKEAPFANLVDLEITLNHALKLVDMIMLEYQGAIHPSDLHAIIHKLWSKNRFTSIRDMLQFVGTDILRDLVDPDYHYNTVVKWIRDNNITKAVISDVRFPNERDNLERDFGDQAVTFLVMRPSLQRNETSGHASENSLGNPEDYNFIIDNDGSLEDLYQKIEIIMDGK